MCDPIRTPTYVAYCTPTPSPVGPPTEQELAIPVPTKALRLYWQLIYRGDADPPAFASPSGVAFLSGAYQLYYRRNEPSLRGRSPANNATTGPGGLAPVVDCTHIIEPSWGFVAPPQGDQFNRGQPVPLVAVRGSCDLVLRASFPPPEVPPVAAGLAYWWELSKTNPTDNLGDDC